MKKIILALCAVALVGCGTDLKLVCTGNETTEVDGNITQTVPAQEVVSIKSESGKPGAYDVSIGAERMDAGNGNKVEIAAFNFGLPGINMKFNQSTSAIVINRWNREIGDSGTPGKPYILKTFTGVCK